MTINPSDRATVENLMKDRCQNLGQKEELKPYTQLSCENMDPWVTQRMMKARAYRGVRDMQELRQTDGHIPDPQHK